MSNISASLVKELREKTGAGMMDCKAALKEAGGSMEQAIEILRKKGLKDLGKRSGKVAAEGTIGTYIHSNGQVVAIVELNCETDFVARGEDFQNTARDMAMHVAAMSPLYIDEGDVPEQLRKKEEEIALEGLSEQQKSKADKILPGKMKKFFQDVVLLEQPFVKDESGKKSVREVIEELAVRTGEKVQIRRFQRFQVGEGIEKPVENLADEVAATISGEH